MTKKAIHLNLVSKSAYAVGALYTAPGDLDTRFAYGHTNFETGASYAHRLRWCF